MYIYIYVDINMNKYVQSTRLHRPQTFILGCIRYAYGLQTVYVTVCEDKYQNANQRIQYENLSISYLDIGNHICMPVGRMYVQ